MMKLVFFITLFFFVSLGTVNAATISLVSDTSSKDIGTEFTVDVMLESEEPSVGVDLLVEFEKNKLELVSIENGSLFDTYTKPLIDNSLGMASVSGIVVPGKTYQGSGKFATLVFKPIKNGGSDITVVFKNGDRNDTNVADSLGNDILEEVADIRVTTGKNAWGNFWKQFLNVLVFWD